MSTEDPEIENFYIGKSGHSCYGDRQWVGGDLRFRRRQIRGGRRGPRDQGGCVSEAYGAPLYPFTFGPYNNFHDANINVGRPPRHGERGRHRYRHDAFDEDEDCEGWPGMNLMQGNGMDMPALMPGGGGMGGWPMPARGNRRQRTNQYDFAGMY